MKTLTVVPKFAYCTMCKGNRPFTHRMDAEGRAKLKAHYLDEHPEVEYNLSRFDEEQRYFFTACGHANYGTSENLASVYPDCRECYQYYCDDCNYDKHICGGCGEEYSHGVGPHEDGKYCIDELEEEYM